MTNQYFSTTFDQVSIYWRITDFNDGFEVKVFLSGDELCSGLLHKDNTQIPFRAKPGYRGPYYLLRGVFKFQHDTEGNPVLSLDIICEPSINQTDYILYPTDAKYPIDIIESEASIQPIDLNHPEEPNEPSQPIDFIEPDKPSQPVEPIDIDNPVKPIHIVNPVPETLPETVFVNSREQQDLFPFVYLHTWSEIKPDELQKRFVKYDSTKVPDIIKYGKDGNAGYLYEELVKLDNNTRSDIKTEADNFIKGGTAKSGKSYQGQFLQSVNDLPGYIKFFALLYTRLRHQRCIDLATIKFGIEKVLRINCWREIKKYVKGQTRYLPELIGENINENTEGVITEYMIAKDRVWQNYFALTIISEHRPHLLEELTKTLVMCHLIEKIVEDDEHCHPGSRIITNEEILEAARATIILPAEIFPLPSASPGETKTTEWIEPYGIGDLQMVRQRLLRYELGEVAYIENVLKGERKETTQRKLNRVNQCVTKSSEQLEEIDDTRVDILNEIQKTLAKDAVTTTFNNLSTEYGTTPSIAKVTGGWTISHAPDSTQPYKEDVNQFAKDITTRTANRIARYVNLVRTFSIVDEAEETVIHAFDNKNNTNNVIGIYRWVNQIYTANVVNYGHRLMLEFMLENPANLYIKSLLNLQGISLEKPIALDQLNPKIGSYEEITRENYANLAIKYQVEDIPCLPDEEKIVLTVFKDGEPNTLKKIQIPEGYRAKSASVVGVFSGVSKLAGFIGQQQFEFTTSPGQKDHDSLTMNQQDNAIAASVLCNSDKDKSDVKYSVSIEVKCTLAPEKLTEWQLKVYQAILEGYHKQQAEYYEKAGVGQAEIKSHSPLKNRQIEKYELKKACIKQMLKQHFQLVGESDENSGNNQPSKFAVNEPRYIQFFEQALEWNEMTYHLYPQVAGQENQDKFAFTALNPYLGNDALFTSFLQAGAARVLVPVRPDYAMLVLYYLSSGTIWPGANSLTPTDEKYVSLVNDLKILSQSDRECKHLSKPWEIVIPTSMIMLQDSSKLPQFPAVL
jgi:hypothetical protein